MVTTFPANAATILLHALHVAHHVASLVLALQRPAITRLRVVARQMAVLLKLCYQAVCACSLHES